MAAKRTNMGHARTARSRRHDVLVSGGMARFIRGIRGIAGLGDSGGLGVDRAAARVARTWTHELLAGYRTDPAGILRPIAARASEGLVVATDIEFSSICRHHLLPFAGRVHVGYAPAGRITGLSRLVKVVDCLSRRLQLQETLTAEIAAAIQTALAPEGAACVIEASHSCMTTRGPRKANTRIVTTACTGAFLREASRRREVLSLMTSQSGMRVRVRR